MRPRKKGGSGKTTVITNLAVYFASLGKRVLIIDLDAQQSVLAWNRVREGQDDIFESITILGLERLLEGQQEDEVIDLKQVAQRARSQWDVVLIDVPGSDNEWQRQALLAADLALMPIVADGFDHLTASSSFDVIEKVQTYRASQKGWTPLKACVVFNRTYTRSRAVREARHAYRDYVTSIDVLDESLTDLNDYRAAAGQGLGVLEWNSTDKASVEVRKLGQYIESVIH